MKAQITLALAILLLVIGGCATTDVPADAKQSPEETVVMDHSGEMPGGSMMEEQNMMGGELKQFSVKAFRFGFEPSTLTVKQGDTVFLQATTADVKHGLTIREYGVDLELEPGEEQTAVFVADKKGTFEMFCSVPCGSGHSSMQGQLIVE
ncbi:cupredoxin domain-containing protein [Candidatus Woesearchaeota archaeon]|nr:cupredoxin domain-containing protein [Candidatus Woesearchaeota archaeon]